MKLRATWKGWQQDHDGMTYWYVCYAYGWPSYSTLKIYI